MLCHLITRELLDWFPSNFISEAIVCPPRAYSETSNLQPIIERRRQNYKLRIHFLTRRSVQRLKHLLLYVSPALGRRLEANESAGRINRQDH
jgi:hypothetical protein